MKFSDYRPYYKNELIIDKVKNYYEDTYKFLIIVLIIF